MGVLPYPLDLISRLEQSFLTLYASRTRPYASKRGYRTPSRALWSWAEQTFLNHVKPQAWARLDDGTQVRVEAQLVRLDERVKNGEVWSPDDLFKQRLPFVEAVAAGREDECAPPTLEEYRLMVKIAREVEEEHRVKVQLHVPNRPEQGIHDRASYRTDLRSLGHANHCGSHPHLQTSLYVPGAR